MSSVTYVIDLSGIAAAIAAIIAFIALIFTASEFRASRKTRELDIFDRSFNNIVTTERILREKYDTIPEEKRVEWDSVLFNQLEYFSFLVNKSYLKDQKMLDFLKDSIVSWFDDIFLKYASEEERTKTNFYPEWKELYKRLEEGK